MGNAANTAEGLMARREGGFTRFQVSLALHCQTGISLSIQDQERTDIVPLPLLRGQQGVELTNVLLFPLGINLETFLIIDTKS